MHGTHATDHELPTLLISCSTAENGLQKVRRPIPHPLDIRKNVEHTIRVRNTFIERAKDCTSSEEDLVERTVRRQIPHPLDIPKNVEHTIRVRNTFIERAKDCTSSSEEDLVERTVTSCPSEHMGRIWQSFTEQEQYKTEGIPSPVLSDIRTPSSPDGVPTGSPSWFEMSAEVDDWGMYGSEFSLHNAISPGDLKVSAGVQQMLPNFSDVTTKFNLSLTDALIANAAAADVTTSSFDPKVVINDMVDESNAFPISEMNGNANTCLSTGMAEQRTNLNPQADCFFHSVPKTAPPSVPAPGSVGLPSIGSAEHDLYRCKPCAFVHNKGCNNGAMCKFCHACEFGERKRRQRHKVEARRANRKAKKYDVGGEQKGSHGKGAPDGAKLAR